MKDRFKRQDNFGEEIPDQYGAGLESYTQPRGIGEDLFVVRDPQNIGERVVATVSSLMEVEE